MTESFDVVVLGGGPAGSVTALQLARRDLRVAVIDNAPPARFCAGETLPPQSSRALRELELFDPFLALAPMASPGTTAVWGSAQPTVSDFLFQTRGNGWHIDRRRFNRMLIEAARQAGVSVLGETAAVSCTEEGGGWRIEAVSGGGRQALRCNLVADATGRATAGRFGFPRARVYDRLIAAIGITAPRAGIVPSDYTLVEAVESGWFYTALLAGGEYVMAYMTDADLYSAGRAETPSFLNSRLAAARYTSERIEKVPEAITVCSAVTSVRHAVAGRNWIAVGDSARSYDPLCGLGIMSAMDMARRAATAAEQMLGGDSVEGIAYENANREAFSRYLAAYKAYYGMERRWAESVFWRRRHEPGPVQRQPVD